MNQSRSPTITTAELQAVRGGNGLAELVVIIDMLGGNCPVQAEGTVNGVPFYFRARGERWTMSIGADPVNVCIGAEPGYHYEEPYGDEKYAAGWMEEGEARALIAKAASLYAQAPTSPQRIGKP